MGYRVRAMPGSSAIDDEVKLWDEGHEHHHRGDCKSVSPANAFIGVRRVHSLKDSSFNWI
jgi:hypothetical protein